MNATGFRAPRRQVGVAVQGQQADCAATCAALLSATRSWRRRTTVQRVLRALTLAAFGGLCSLSLVLIANVTGVQQGAAERLWAVAGLLTASAIAASVVAIWRAIGGGSLADWVARAEGLQRRSEPLRTAVELADAWSVRPSGSAALTSVTVGGAFAELRFLGLHHRDLWRGNFRLAVVVLLLGGAITTVAATEPDPWGFRAVAYDDGDDGPQLVPTLVGDLVLASTPPPYAEGAVLAADNDPEGCAVLRGSVVDVRARPLLSLAQLRVDVRLGDEVRQLPLVAADTQVRWQTTVVQDVQYRYVGVDKRGRPVSERGWRSIEATADAPPSALLSAPQGEVDVRRGATVLVAGRATDDLGLADVQLVVALPGGGTTRRPIAFAVRGRDAEISETIEVDDLHLRAGELATLHLEARDSNPASDRRPVLSRRVTLRMFSPERHHTQVLQELAALALLWTERLADRLERDPLRTGAQISQALSARVAMAAAEEDGLKALKRVVGRLEEDVLSRVSTRANLAEVGELLAEALAEEQRGLSRFSDVSALQAPTRLQARRVLSACKRYHDQAVVTQERSVALMASLARAEHRQALARQGRKLQRLQGRLQTVLGKLANGDADVTVEQAERLLDEVAAQVERMLESLKRQAPLVPAEHFNAAAARHASTPALVGHEQALGKVRELLRAGKHAAALRELKRLREGLKDELAALQKNAAQQNTAADDKLRKLVRLLRRDIATTRAEQRDIHEALRPVSEEHSRELAKHLETAARDVLPQVQALIGDARDQIRPRRLGSAAARSSGPVGRARAALSTAAAAIDARELDGAIAALTEADEQFAGAMRSLPLGQVAGIEGDLVAGDGARLRAGSDRIGRAIALLRESLPSSRELLQPGARRRMQQLRPRQRGVRRRLRHTQQRLRRDGAAHPALQKQVGGRLEHALSLMAQAEDSLRDGDAQRATQQSAEADSALQQAARMLSEPDQGPQSGAAAGFAPPQRPVELDGERPLDGRAFRDALLKAMQKPAPNGYRERLQRYYEAIAQ